MLARAEAHAAAGHITDPFTIPDDGIAGERVGSRVENLEADEGPAR